MKATLIAAVLLASLGGCATQAQQQFQRITNQFEAADADWDSCMAPAYASEAELIYSQRLISGHEDPQKLEKMMIDGYATSEEKEAAVSLNASAQPCREKYIQAQGAINPALVGVHAKMFAASDERLVRLLKNEISIGEFNRGKEPARAAWLQEYSEIVERTYSQLNQSHQYEMAQRQRSALALQALNYQQQQLYDTSRAASMGGVQLYQFPGGMMNCTTIGNVTNCY
jgi:hypothetical protein